MHVRPPGADEVLSATEREMKLPSLAGSGVAPDGMAPVSHKTLSRSGTAPAGRVSTARAMARRVESAAMAEALRRLLQMSEDDWGLQLEAHDTIFLECIRQVWSSQAA